MERSRTGVISADIEAVLTWAFGAYDLCLQIIAVWWRGSSVGSVGVVRGGEGEGDGEDERKHAENCRRLHRDEGVMVILNRVLYQG